MVKVNIRVVSNLKGNGHLSIHHQHAQNRAAAVLDAHEEFGESMMIDIVAYLHRISVEQIRKDLYGDLLPRGILTQPTLSSTENEGFDNSSVNSVLECSDADSDILPMPPSKRQKTLSHETTALAVSQLELDWLVTHKNG
ncbi:unnamed protein product, partial [Rotaria magnacalcarata]